MKKLVVIGGGGHAKVVINILHRCPQFEVIGCLDHAPASRRVLNVEVIGEDTLLPQLHAQGVSHAFVAIGDNARRAALSHEVRKLGFKLATLISPTATIVPDTELGNGVAIMDGVVIQPDARIGESSIINTRACVEHDCVIGRSVHIAPGCTLAGGVHVEALAFLGVGTVAIPGVRIGAGSVIGAGAVITGNIPPGVVAVGVPARIVRRL
jgi:UDP-perosamine 4-acetyltransferase